MSHLPEWWIPSSPFLLGLWLISGCTEQNYAQAQDTQPLGSCESLLSMAFLSASLEQVMGGAYCVDLSVKFLHMARRATDP